MKDCSYRTFSSEKRLLIRRNAFQLLRLTALFPKFKSIFLDK